MEGKLLYYMHEPVSDVSKDSVRKDLEKIVDIGGRKVIVVQKTLLRSHERFVYIPGYIVKDAGIPGKIAYWVDLVEDPAEQAKVLAALAGDSSLEGRVNFQGRYNRRV